MPRLIERFEKTLRSPREKLVLPSWPRGMREEFAAAYVGLSVTTMAAEVRAGRFPAPVALTKGRKVWIKDDLDRYLDRAAGYSEDQSLENNPWMTA